MYFNYDPFIGPIFIVFILSLIAQWYVKATFQKYSEVRVQGRNGHEVAAKISGVPVELSPGGQLSDHYDPRDRKIYLSPEVFDGDNAAAIGVAAHEAGHALQDARGYLPLKFRSSFFPAANLGSNLSVPLFFAGMIFSIPPLMDLGIIFFFFTVVFSLITLPVELDASRRAVQSLDGVLTSEQLFGVKKVLTAAALTYLAATVMAMLQFLRLLYLRNSRED